MAGTLACRQSGRLCPGTVRVQVSCHLKMSPDQPVCAAIQRRKQRLLRLACNTIIRYPIKIECGHWLRAKILLARSPGRAPPNAGHTLVIDGVTYKLSLLPSGVVRPGKLSVIGNGVVLDPFALIEEISRLKGQGVQVTPESLRIAENVTLILPLHQELDAFRESANRYQIGTTRRGIGPAYEDKVGRRAIRLMDLADLSVLGDKIDRLLAHHNALLRGMNLSETQPNAIYNVLAEIAPRVLPSMHPFLS